MTHKTMGKGGPRLVVSFDGFDSGKIRVYVLMFWVWERLRGSADPGMWGVVHFAGCCGTSQNMQLRSASSGAPGLLRLRFQFFWGVVASCPPEPAGGCPEASDPGQPPQRVLQPGAIKSGSRQTLEHKGFIEFTGFRGFTFEGL